MDLELIYLNILLFHYLNGKYLLILLYLIIHFYIKEILFNNLYYIYIIYYIYICPKKLAQLVRAFVLHAKGYRFEFYISYYNIRGPRFTKKM